MWPYRLGDAKITAAYTEKNDFIIELDCTPTMLDPECYIQKIVFKDAEIIEAADIGGCFWYREEVTRDGTLNRMRLKVSDVRNKKKLLRIAYRNIKVI